MDVIHSGTELSTTLGLEFEVGDVASNLFILVDEMNFGSVTALSYPSPAS